MIIEFNLEYMSKTQREIIPEFLDGFVSQLKREIVRDTIPAKMKLREIDILNASWIRWKKKPKHINMKSLVNYIVGNIRWVKRDNYFIIEMNRSTLMPNSHTSLYAIARFLDRGNNVMKGTAFISKVFNKYRKCINDYWKSFVSLKLREVVVNECISIK